ncbi:MAG: dihydrodipicolinate reductase C-terminal domain-containing protein [Candidatus Baltobacteraceae bacterium]
MRVAVAGAMGRIGSVAREALLKSGEYCCGLARRADARLNVFDSLDEVLAQKPDVLLDLTTQPGSFEISTEAAKRGVNVVVGASGWSPEQRAAFKAAVDERQIGALIVPNFSLGATLMMRFAQEAARIFPDVEIVEMHHSTKKDKPSGTALETAARIACEGKAPAVHSVRLPGLISHQEVLFGGNGELLTIRHDSYSYESFVTGMLAAVRWVAHRRGLSIGLDAVLGDLAASGGAA